VPVDHDSPVPLYRQVARQLRERIASGELTRRLPSLRDIEQTYEVSRPVAEKAVRLLIDAGEAYVVPGKGTYLGQPEPDALHQAVTRDEIEDRWMAMTGASCRWRSCALGRWRTGAGMSTGSGAGSRPGRGQDRKPPAASAARGDRRGHRPDVLG
jgi:DNA-binding transcriptional regulator YhcF (GntR family)